AGGDGYGYRWFYPPACGAVWHYWPEADLRSGVPVRDDCLCIFPGSGRADGAYGGRRGVDDECDGGARSEGFHLYRPGGSGLHCHPERAAEGPEDWLAEGILQRSAVSGYGRTGS